MNKQQYIDRLDRVVAQLPENADGAFVTSQVCRFYLTGYNADTGFLLVTRGGCAFVTDARYIEAASAALEGICPAVCYTRGKFGEVIVGLCGEMGAKSLIIERGSVTLAEVERYEKSFEPVEILRSEHLDNIISSMRLSKTEFEMEQIKAAQRLTERSLRRILGMIKEGVSEREIALELEFDMRRSGAEKVAFDLIVAAGPNGSMPHAVPSDYRIRPGDLITFDIGSTVNGYNSDMTRTVAFGRISDEQLKVYETVRTAQKAAIDYITAGGFSCPEADQIARTIITEAGYGECFGHGLGHGVGVEIHEAPTLSHISKDDMCEGCVVTVEPGIYLEGKFGVRIEDMLYITKDSAIDLTDFETDLIVLN